MVMIIAKRVRIISILFGWNEGHHHIEPFERGKNHIMIKYDCANHTHTQYYNIASNHTTNEHNSEWKNTRNARRAQRINHGEYFLRFSIFFLGFGVSTS